MSVLYPNLFYNEVCYKGTALYIHVVVEQWKEIYADISGVWVALKFTHIWATLWQKQISICISQSDQCACCLPEDIVGAWLPINMGESCQDYSLIQDFEADFPQKVSLKILN